MAAEELDSVIRRSAPRWRNPYATRPLMGSVASKRRGIRSLTEALERFAVGLRDFLARIEFGGVRRMVSIDSDDDLGLASHLAGDEIVEA